MAEDELVRRLLVTAADRLGDITPPPVDTLVRRRRRRASLRQAVTVAAAVVTVTGVAVAIDGRATGPATPTVEVRSPPAVGSTGPSLAAAAFETYRWRALPVAPIPVRTGSAAVWTGSQLFVWGGAIGDDARSDGAMYDPAARRWTVLPPSPLPASATAQAVAVDGSVVVWTGTRGALFDPSSKSWSALPTPPAGPGTQAATQLVAAGDLAVLVRARTDGASRTVQADSYDVPARRWVRGSRVSTPDGHGIDGLTALAVGRDVAVWPRWYHRTTTRPGTFSVAFGVDAYQFDPDAGTWQATRAEPGDGRDARGALWTGTDVLFPQTNWSCGPCKVPPISRLTPRLVDPVTGTASTIADDPLGVAGDTLFWTGGALLSYDAGAQQGSVVGGDLAVWDATTGRWARLAAAGVPRDAAQDVVVWTGSALLVWGIGVDGTPAGTGGMQFAAP